MVHSVEDYLTKKIGLEKTEYVERPKKAMIYFNKIMTGEIQTSPYELMVMMNLLYDLIKHDKEAIITSYMIHKQMMIYDFFRKNFQRFNYFEFKPLLAKLRGEMVDQAITISAQEKSGEKIRKLNTRDSTMLLDNNPTYIQRIRMIATTENNRLDKNAVDLLGETVRAKFKEDDLTVLKNLENSKIPYIQKHYNPLAIEKLEKYFTTQLAVRITDIFEQLDMSITECENFLMTLRKKIEATRGRQ